MKKPKNKGNLQNFVTGAALALLVVTNAPASANLLAEVMGPPPGNMGGQPQQQMPPPPQQQQGGQPQVGQQQGGQPQVGQQQGGQPQGGQQQGGQPQGGQPQGNSFLPGANNFGGQSQGGQPQGGNFGGNFGGQQGGQQQGGNFGGQQQGGQQQGGNFGGQQQGGQQQGGNFGGQQQGGQPQGGQLKPKEGNMLQDNQFTPATGANKSNAFDDMKNQMGKPSTDMQNNQIVDPAFHPQSDKKGAFDMHDNQIVDPAFHPQSDKKGAFDMQDKQIIDPLFHDQSNKMGDMMKDQANKFSQMNDNGMNKPNGMPMDKGAISDRQFDLSFIKPVAGQKAFALDKALENVDGDITADDIAKLKKTFTKVSAFTSLNSLLPAMQAFGETASDFCDAQNNLIEVDDSGKVISDDCTGRQELLALLQTAQSGQDPTAKGKKMNAKTRVKLLKENLRKMMKSIEDEFKANAEENA